MLNEIENDAKTWQEIKLRKPSQELCDTIHFVMGDFSEISASKALEKLILNYPRQKAKIDDLQTTARQQNHKIRELEIELAKQKKLVADIRQSYKSFTALLSD